MGYCHIIDGHLVITKNDTVEDINKVKPAYNKMQSIIIVLALIGVMVYFFIDSSMKQDRGGMLFSGVLAVFSVMISFSVFSNSAQPVIKKESIQSLQYIKGLNGFTRSRFAVTFLDDSGKLRKSLIVLPGTLADGKKVAAEAFEKMKEAYPEFLG